MAEDFLFELGCEELPTFSVKPLADALAAQIEAELKAAKLSFTHIKAFATPRRLAVAVTALQDMQPPTLTVKRGPALAAAYNAERQPSAALLGFAKSCQVSLEQLSILKTEKGEWVQYIADEPGAETIALLPSIIKKALHALPIAKPMRWGNHTEEFARPVHWLVMLYGQRVIDMTLFGIQSGQHTYGHRFHHPQAITLLHPHDYEAALEKAFVIADYVKRREAVIKQVQAIATAHESMAVMPEDLIDEVTAIIEWPNALFAQFDEAFLQIPQEVLIAAMQHHQKTFALRDSRHQLKPGFITVANIHSKDPSQVVAGNEKVMRARLSDAAFFFHQDKKQVLSSLAEATHQVVFQAQLGSLQDKTQRMAKWLEMLTEPLQLDAAEAARAAYLSKCDLLTGMVGEFPELQGLMGYYYAQSDGESKAVAQALQEQYLPRFSADELPASALGTALSLADRMDTLAGIFIIGQKPSGVKDPFKLRRHALAVARLLMTIPAQLSLNELIVAAAKNYAFLNQEKSQISELSSFIIDRLQAYYQSVQISADLVHAVLKCQKDWFYDLDQRLKALAEFVLLPAAGSLSAACKRVNNILSAAQDIPSENALNPALFVEPAERQLYDKMQAIDQLHGAQWAVRQYTHILTNLATLREPVDTFFDQVMVMTDDMAIRRNRLALLKQLQRMMQTVADISTLQLAVHAE